MCGFGVVMSILSFKDRGKWGKSSYRGNCSGFVYQEMFSWLKPNVFVDPMAGSMTSIEVAQEMGIEAYGLDLHSGFNILKDRIIDSVKKEADLVFSHPPYGGMILYSGNVWGESHPDDLSRCIDDDDFNNKLQLALLNQREATRDGGFYGTLIGDWRRQGSYSSYQAEIIARMPKDELASVIIKAQHNTMSGRINYGKQALPMISHEYMLLWQKKQTSFFALFRGLALSQQQRLSGTWHSIIRLALMQLGGTAPLDQLYDHVFAASPDRATKNIHWKAKVRQTLQLNEDFLAVERGVWKII